MKKRNVLVRPIAEGLTALRQRGPGGLAVNVYALECAGNLTLIDAGYPGRTSELIEAIQGLGYDLDSIARVFYTHTHVDHMGAGPDWSELTQAEHVLPRTALDFATDWDAIYEKISDWRPWLLDVIEDPAMLAAIRDTPQRVQPSGRGPIAPTKILEPGEVLACGDYSLESLPIPGHDPHHVALVDRVRQVAFTGDSVLAIQTPLSRVMGDSLDAYLESLDLIESLDLEILYPGHGAPLTRVAEQIARSRQFVLQNNHFIITELKGGSRSLHELACCQVDAEVRNLARFSLVLANLDSCVHYLEQRGTVRRHDGRIFLK